MKGLSLLIMCDIKTARYALSCTDDAMLKVAAYHTEQAVEKHLKLLIENTGNRYQVIHEIGVLCDDCDKLHLNYPSIYREWNPTITDWCTKPRYNANYMVSRNNVMKVLEAVEVSINKFISSVTETDIFS
jgi:HEPN domain-containing protein